MISLYSELLIIDTSGIALCIYLVLPIFMYLRTCCSLDCILWALLDHLSRKRVIGELREKTDRWHDVRDIEILASSLYVFIIFNRRH